MGLMFLPAGLMTLGKFGLDKMKITLSGLSLSTTNDESIIGAIGGFDN